MHTLSITEQGCTAEEGYLHPKWFPCWSPLKPSSSKWKQNKQNNKRGAKKTSEQSLNQQPTKTPATQLQQSTDRRHRYGDSMDPNLESPATPSDHQLHPSGYEENHHLISSVVREVQIVGQSHSAPWSSLQSSIWPNQFPSVQQLSFSIVNNIQQPATTVNMASIPTYGHPPAQSTAGIAVYQPLAALQVDSNLPRQAQGGGWRAGSSLHKYELVSLQSNVNKCYRCDQEFSDRLQQSTSNTVIKHIDCRLVWRDGRTGNFLYSADYSNVLPLGSCVCTAKNTLFHWKGVHFFQ